MAAQSGGEELALYTQAQLDTAIAGEWERCAKIAEDMRPTGGRMWTEGQHACFAALTDCAAAIRKQTDNKGDNQ